MTPFSASHQYSNGGPHAESPIATLIGVASPEQVSRRVERAEQDITAISDTVLDIKETVGAHTETLAEHGRKLDAIHGRLEVLESRMEEGFAEILRRLDAR